MGILTPLEDELNKISVDFEKKKKKIHASQNSQQHYL